MKKIPLTKNKMAIIDDEDFDLVMAHSWSAAKYGSKYYASTRINGKTVYMHRLILNPPNEKRTDHINGNGLDNRRQNLRECNIQQNARNATRLHAMNTSGFRGVSLSSRKNLTKKWIANINISKNGKIKQKSLGYFLTAEDAAKAFDRAAKEIYGEFCGILNFEKFPRGTK